MDEQKIRKYQEYLLYLIKNDPEVRNAIRSLANDENQCENQICINNEKLVSEYKVKIDTLENDLQIMKDENSDLVSEKFNLSLQIDELNGKIRKIISERQELIDRYGTLNGIYKKYCCIDEELRASFEPIINVSSVTSFLLSGASLDALRLLFEKICMEYKKYTVEQMEALNEVFDYLFSEFQLLNKEYSRTEAVIGEEFDLNKHTRTSESTPVGKVKRVIINGFINNMTNKKIKSFVEIG